MTLSATRRWHDLIGEDRLTRGSQLIEPALGETRSQGAVLNGKVAVITSLLYPRHIFINPYLSGSDLDHAYKSGCATERADLADVVRVMQR